LGFVSGAPTTIASPLPLTDTLEPKLLPSVPAELGAVRVTRLASLQVVEEEEKEDENQIDNVSQ
jgi:hypothetical protein